MSWQSKNWTSEKQVRTVLQREAMAYFKNLPTPLACNIHEGGAKLRVTYALPFPYQPEAYYYPEKGEWLYTPKFIKEAKRADNPCRCVLDPVRRRVRSTEEFVKLFAPSSFGSSTPSKSFLAKFYEHQGGDALHDAVRRGEFERGGFRPAHPATGAPMHQVPPHDQREPPTAATPEEAGERPDTEGPPGVAGGTAEAGINRGGLLGPDELKTGNAGAGGRSGRARQSRQSHKRVPASGATAPPSTAYITALSRVFASQSAFVDEVMAGVTTTVYDATRRFLCHLIVSGQPRYGEEKVVPVGAPLIRRKLRVRRTELVWDPLRDAGLISYTRESKEWRRSRTFTVEGHVRDRFLAAVPRVDDLGAARFVDLITGKPSAARADLQYKTDSTGHSYPVLVQDALAELRCGGCPVDLLAAEAHVAELFAVYQDAQDAWEADGRLSTGRSHSSFLTAQGRFWVDRHCLTAMLETAPVRAADGLWRCVPRYLRDPQTSGRLTEIGGLQNCSREMKHAALAGLRLGHDVRNYDLVGSQAWGLVQLFEDAGIDTDWLRTYVASDKGDYAERAFGDRSAESVDLWKACLFALFMGAKVPATVKDIPRFVLDLEGLTRKPMEIAVGIRDAFGAGEVTAEANAKLASFKAVVAPFLASRNAWHDSLESQAQSDRAFAVPGRGGRYVRNAAGMTFRVDDKTGFTLRSKLAAHLLQGLEAAFIHRLTALAPTYGFSAVNNQHDGLLTVGEVPVAAVEQARADSGLRYPALKEKRYRADLAVPGLPD